VGRTRQGGSCNVDVLRLIPHCNGTHTETISHIVNGEIWIGHLATQPVYLALLITVEPQLATQTHERYRPELDPQDQVITAEQIRSAAVRHRPLKPDALVVRTVPNPPSKRSRIYSQDETFAFLTLEAMQAVNELGVLHLLVDVPSVDRMYDDGLLTNHHVFWNVTPNTHELGVESRQEKTITEMVFVPDELLDGIYGLSLQIPAFCSDAAPSRPVLFPVKAVT
jgi:hypothetical protein